MSDVNGQNGIRIRPYLYRSAFVILAAVGVFEVLSLRALRASQSINNTGILRWDRTSVDLGEMRAGRRVTFPVRFQNVSTKNVSVRADGCCGIAINAVPLTVAPGAFGTLYVKMEVEQQRPGLPPKDSLKPFTAHIAEVPTYEQELELKYRSKGGWWPVPRTLEFNNVEEGSSATLPLKIYLDPAAPGVVGVSSNDIRVSTDRLCTVHGPVGQSDVMMCQVKVNLSSSDHGDFSTSLSFRTTDPDEPSFSLPVLVHVKPAITTTPDYLQLGTVSPGSHVIHNIQVRSARFAVSKVVISRQPSWVRTQVERIDKHTMQVQVTPGASISGPVSGEIQLRITAGGESLQDVPVIAYGDTGRR